MDQQLRFLCRRFRQRQQPDHLQRRTIGIPIWRHREQCQFLGQHRAGDRRGLPVDQQNLSPDRQLRQQQHPDHRKCRHRRGGLCHHRTGWRLRHDQHRQVRRQRLRRHAQHAVHHVRIARRCHKFQPDECVRAGGGNPGERIGFPAWQRRDDARRSEHLHRRHDGECGTIGHHEHERAGHRQRDGQWRRARPRRRLRAASGRQSQHRRRGRLRVAASRQLRDGRGHQFHGPGQSGRQPFHRHQCRIRDLFRRHGFIR